jgi:hypothetical protein
MIKNKRKSDASVLAVVSIKGIGIPRRMDFQKILLIGQRAG